MFDQPKIQLKCLASLLEEVLSRFCVQHMFNYTWITRNRRHQAKIQNKKHSHTRIKTCQISHQKTWSREVNIFWRIITWGSVWFVAINALKVVPLKLLMFRAETPTARYLDVMASEGPSNSIFCTNSSTALRALNMPIQKQDAQMRRLKNFQTKHSTRRPFSETENIWTDKIQKI